MCSTTQTFRRIIEIDPARYNELMKCARFGVSIKLPKNATTVNEYVVETDDPNEIGTVNKIVELFDVSL